MNSSFHTWTLRTDPSSPAGSAVATVESVPAGSAAGAGADEPPQAARPVTIAADNASASHFFFILDSLLFKLWFVNYFHCIECKC
jgi:hypothetical protein